jgi:protein SCO1
MNLVKTWRTSLLLVACAGQLASRAAEQPPDYEAPRPGSYVLPVIKPAGDGEVLEATGRKSHLREVISERVTVLSFIYTRCAATRACPYATGVLNELHLISQTNQALAKNLRLVSLSFDPANDTPARMADYSAWLRSRPAGAEWRFLTTASAAQLQPILAAYGQAVDKRSNPADPQGPLTHILRVFLIDARGRIRNIYSADTLDPRLVRSDIETLLMERKDS